jgi:hypothetical protein
VIDEFSVSCLI